MRFLLVHGGWQRGWCWDAVAAGPVPGQEGMGSAATLSSSVASSAAPSDASGWQCFDRERATRERRPLFAHLPYRLATTLRPATLPNARHSAMLPPPDGYSMP